MSYAILILSSPDDVHYRAVDWALRQVGMTTHLLFGNCFPQNDTHTLTFDNDLVRYEVETLGERLDLLAASVVWYRRAHWPVISTSLSEADQDAARREAEMFVGGARSVAARRQRWINDPDRELVANRKPLQLEVARRAGLKIPRTLMSNNPLLIREFFETAKGEVVLKPFHAMQWRNKDEHFVLFANKLTYDDIQDSSALQLTSHIIQDYVEKSYELRVFYLGGKILPFKLHTQDHSATKTDWRISTDGALRPEPYGVLPTSVCDGIEWYMRELGLAYGAFDFVVDSEGQYVFLECNVSGQFLFIEEWNPDISILSEFVRFLCVDIDLTKAQRDAIDGLRYLDFYHSNEQAAYYEAMSARYPTKSVSRNLHREMNDA